MTEALLLFFLGLIIAVVSFYMGWRYHGQQVMILVSDIMEELVIDLEIERVDEQYFLYKKDDGQFVCQADTLSALAESFSLQMGVDRIGRVTGYTNFSIVEGRVEQ